MASLGENEKVWYRTGDVASENEYDTGEGIKIPTHRYPIYIDNLNSENNVPIVQECIHFTAIKQGGISLQTEASNSKALAREANDNFRQDHTDKNGLTIMDSIGNGSSGSYDAVSEQNKAGSAQEDIKNGVRSITEKFTEGGVFNKKARKFYGYIKDQLSTLKSPPKNLEHCFLYMPSSVQLSEGASWGAEAIGASGNLIKEAARGKGSLSDMLSNFGGGLASKIGAGAAVGAGALLSGALGAVGAAYLLEGVGGGLRAAGRFTQNPYEEQLFNGIEFRTFSFEFAFAPSSEAEGQEVLAIINMFRKHSRPNFVGGPLGEGIYTFPNEFNIEFLMNTESVDQIGHGGEFIPNFHIPKIHNCVCTNVATNFTPEGFWVALRDGRPVSYSLGLSFTETKKITQDDIELEDY
jgi:hypothetical protein